jgi:GTP cyclohydrolase II
VSAVSIRTEVRLHVRVADGSLLPADAFTFEGLTDGLEHLALGLGPHKAVEVPLVRLHSECLTGDVFGSAHCDCGPQLRESIDRIAASGGYLLYLRQEGRGIGLYNKLDTYLLQTQGLDTFEANRAIGWPEDARDYRAAAEMLQALGRRRIDVVTNNPDKVAQLREYGVHVRTVQPTSAFVTDANVSYLRAKAHRQAHALDIA